VTQQWPGLEDAYVAEHESEVADRTAFTLPSAAQTKLRALRLSARRLEVLNNTSFAMMFGVVAGFLTTFVILQSRRFTSQPGNTSVDALILGFTLGTLIGTLIAYPIVVSLRRSNYGAAATILHNTELPQLILDEDFQARVRAIVNRGQLIRFPPARTIEGQIRFVGEYWSFFVSAMGGSYPGIPDVANWSTIKRVFVYGDKSEYARASYRIRAICDFFLGEHPFEP
jgi:hypothetical protein